MPARLRDAMREVLAEWDGDLDVAWRPLLANTLLDFDAIDPGLEIEPWEPIFPVRRGKVLPGMPSGAHMLRAFDSLSPQKVRCVILGQDPFPAAEAATGRAFEIGNLATWRELDKMFTKSIRALIQLVAAARTDNDSYASNFLDWPRTLNDIEAGKIDLGTMEALIQRWINAGVLLLNSALTLSRFRVEVDPHQARGHVPLWRPLILAALKAMAKRETPVAFIGFGGVAAENLALAGIREGRHGSVACILREHPADADAVLARENPFRLCNGYLAEMGAAPIAW